MKEIKLTKGLVALVGDEDFEWLNQYKWHVHTANDKKRCQCYAARSVRQSGKPRQRVQYMHKLILGADETKTLVDHKDGNKLNNQRQNLRIANSYENQHNQVKHCNNTSGYKGVSWNKSSNKWQVSIQINNKNKYIGVFENKIDAAKEYDKNAVLYFGEFANLNFPMTQDKEPEPEPVETPGQIELGKLIAAMESRINEMKGAQS